MFIRLSLVWTLALVTAALGRSADPQAVADRIDRLLTDAHVRAGVTPAAIADDAEFLRRIYLDATGTIPTASEAVAFIDATDVGKRAKLIDRLLASPAFARHFATVWRRTWLPQADTPATAPQAEAFERWLRTRLAAGVSYDGLVRDVLAAPARPEPDAPSAAWAFLELNGFRPEDLAANASRAFLGLNLDCAQCHDHPFAKWSREQFWETAAFFAPPGKGGAPAERLAVVIPGTRRTAAPALVTGEAVPWPEQWDDRTGRRVFANWATEKANPYFARNAVNRVWSQLFGTGLVEPLDALVDEKPPVHPKLLDELAAAFADSNFDLRFLVAAVTRSRAYQRTGRWPSGQTPPPAESFARSEVRGLGGEQLFHALLAATGRPVTDDARPDDPAVVARRRFADRFRSERPARSDRTIPQALLLMNGESTAEGTSTVRAVAEAPFLSARQKLDTLFLATLSRRPTPDEARPLLARVEAASRGRERDAWEDVFWALLNSAEFGTNH